jgi:cardiolipin synthase
MINQRILESLIVFVVAGLSDAADGFIARVFHKKSNMGAYLDPLADKILLVAAFITMAMFKMLPPWLAVLTVSRDFIILLGVLVLYLNNYPVKVRPSVLSKATTFSQVVTIIIILFNKYLNIQFFEIYLFWLVALLTIFSGLQYIKIGLTVLSKGMNGDFS